MNKVTGAYPPVELKHRLRIAREFAALDQGKLADRMAVSRNTVSNAEKGFGTPRRITLNAWAAATGVSIDWLVDGDVAVPA
jgi:transcriptional regulator with XRE-family HTH domain